MTAIGVGATAAVVLKIVFMLARVSWPENYFDSTDRASHWFTDSPVKVLIWRLLPYALVSIAVGSFASSAHVSVAGSLWSFYIAHLLSTNVLSLAVAFRDGVGVSGRYAYLLSVAVVLAIITAAAASVPELLVEFTPSSEGLVEGVWTAILVAVIFAGYKTLTDAQLSRSADEKPFADLKVSEYYIGVIARESYSNTVDLPLMLSIVALESSSRPKFIRRIEVFLSEYKLGTHQPKTVGIAQQPPNAERVKELAYRNRLRSYDEASIESLVNLFKETVPGPEVAKFGPNQVKSLADRNNRGSVVIAGVSRIYSGLYSTGRSVMRDVYLSRIDDGPDGVESSADARSSLPADGVYEEIVVNAPWAVRCGTHVYLQFKIPTPWVSSVELRLVDDDRSRSVIESFEFTKSSKECVQGLYLLPNLGAGIQINVYSSAGAKFVAPILWYSSTSDICTIDS